jgi:hypothetical protein
MEMAMALQGDDTEFTPVGEATSLDDWSGVSWAVLSAHAGTACSRLSAPERAGDAATTENADAGDHTGFSMVGIAG